MDLQTIAAIFFLAILTIFVFLKRKNLEIKQIIPRFLYLSMYRTSIGLKSMDFIAGKWRKFMLYVGYAGILVGFIGMLFISYTMLNNVYLLYTQPEAAPGVGLVLPFKAKGVFFVPFFYWIISIFVIAAVHEFSHGLISKANNIKVKSSGFAFFGTGFRLSGLGIVIISLYVKISHSQFYNFNLLDYSSPDFWIIIGVILVILSFIKGISKIGYIPIIPAAFVEPDEKELRKRPHKEQLSVFAAGPFSNILAAFVFILISSFVLAPIVNGLIEPNGVKITDYVKDKEKFPAEIAGIRIGEVIQKVDGIPTPYVKNLSMVLRSKKPNDVVAIITDKYSYEIKLAKNPENESLAYLGAYLEQSTSINADVKVKYGEMLPNTIIWTYGLFIILFILNLGIGLFNLVPIGPLDGGRMLQLVLDKFFGKEKGNKAWYVISMFFMILILVNLIVGFIK